MLKLESLFVDLRVAERFDEEDVVRLHLESMTQGSLISCVVEIAREDIDKYDLS